jgi:hypothetical protein
MQPVLGPDSAQASAALAMDVDTSAIINRLSTVKEARSLPAGSIVGDLHGGLTFTDAVAAALEVRSLGGWREWQAATGETWTIIALDQ